MAVSVCGQEQIQASVAIQQRVLAGYRIPFFDSFAEQCSGNLCVFAGHADSSEATVSPDKLVREYVHRTQNVRAGIGRCAFYWQRGLAELIKQHQPDVLVMEANPRLLSSYLSVRTMHSLKRPVVGWGLGVLNWDSPRWVEVLRRQLVARFYRCFDALIAYGSAGAEQYLQLGVDPNRIFIAPNAVSHEWAIRTADQLQRQPYKLDKWRDEIGLTRVPVVMYLGRLLREKRVDDLISACSAIESPCQLLIVGDGPQRASLESHARSVGVDTMFVGHKVGAELGRCFALADLCVLPGSGGLAVNEAISYGKPVIATLGDGTIRDMVVDGVNGHLFTSGDVASLASLISGSIRNTDKLKAMGMRSHEISRDRQNIGCMVRGFVEALQFVMESQKVADIE